MATLPASDIAAESSLRSKMFKDVKFWVARRIPMRDHHINLIKEGGGVIVLLEKHADMLIADDARKDSPPGSYSWKFIQDSVKNGVVQLKDRYAIGRNIKEPRPVASGGLTRSGRVEFTSADDADLIRYVLSHANNRTGNAIYQEYEIINSRHTWQSWQNRWRKKLQYYSQEQLERMAAVAPEEPPPQAEPTRPSVPFRRRPQNPSVPASRTTAPSQPAPVESQGQEPVLPPKSRSPPATSNSKSKSPLLVTAPAPTIETETPPDLNKEEFYKDLGDYVSFSKLDINMNPIIRGKRISLFKLAQTVCQGVPEEDINWPLVAIDLDFDDLDNDLMVEIEQCWDDNLRDFLQHMTAPDEEDEEESQHEGGHDTGAQNGEAVSHTTEDEGGSQDEEVDAANIRERVDGQPVPETTPEDQDSGDDLNTAEAPEVLTIPNTNEDEQSEEQHPQNVAGDQVVPATAQDEDEDTESQHPPSGPRVTTKKRSLDSEASPMTRSKRRRLGRDATIPSTPEDRLRQLPPLSHRLQNSPSLERQRQRLRRMAATDTIKDSQDDTQDKLQTSPIAARQQSPELGSDNVWPPATSQMEASPIVLGGSNIRDRSRMKQPVVPTSRPLTQPFTSPMARPSAPVQATKKRRILPSSFQQPGSPRPPSPPPIQHHIVPTPAAIANSLRQQLREEETQEERGTPNRGNPRSITRQPSTIEEWQEHYKSLGYSSDIITKAMHATTMTPGSLIVTFLDSFTVGKGVPSHHEGIWTDRDDRALELVLKAGDLKRTASDAAELQLLQRAQLEKRRLKTKHGLERMRLRSKYLQCKKEYDQGMHATTRGRASASSSSN